MPFVARNTDKISIEYMIIDRSPQKQRPLSYIRAEKSTFRSKPIIDLLDVGTKCKLIYFLFYVQIDNKIIYI